MKIKTVMSTHSNSNRALSSSIKPLKFFMLLTVHRRAGQAYERRTIVRSDRMLRGNGSAKALFAASHSLSIQGDTVRHTKAGAVKLVKNQGENVVGLGRKNKS